MNRYVLSILKLKASLVLAVLLSACASYDPVNVEEDFGNSVRHMIDQQVNGDDASKNLRKVKSVVDGETVMGSMETYRRGQTQSSKKNASDQLKLGN